MKRPGIVIVGAGGHGRVVADLIAAAGKHEAVGFVDPSPSSRIPSLPRLGGDERLVALLKSGVRAAAIGLGASPNILPRRALRKTVQNRGFVLPALIHPRAVVSEQADVAEGSQVMAGAVVQPGTSLGAHSVVNTSAVIEHDCHLGEDAFIASGAVLGGGVSIGDGAFVGLGAVILPGVSVGAWAIVAAGAVVTSAVPSRATVIGAPARKR